MVAAGGMVARDNTARVTVTGLTVAGAGREWDTRIGVVFRGDIPSRKQAARAIVAGGMVARGRGARPVGRLPSSATEERRLQAEARETLAKGRWGLLTSVRRSTKPWFVRRE